MIIITNAGIFADVVKKWNTKSDANKTWPNFKNHFTDTQYNYKRVRPSYTADSLGCNSQKINVVEEFLLQLDQQKETKAELWAQEESQCILAEYQANQLMAESNAFQYAPKTKLQVLVKTVNALKYQINNNKNCNRDNYKRDGYRGWRGGHRKTKTKATELKPKINIVGHTAHAAILYPIAKIQQTSIKNKTPSNQWWAEVITTFYGSPTPPDWPGPPCVSIN